MEFTLRHPSSIRNASSHCAKSQGIPKYLGFLGIEMGGNAGKLYLFSSVPDKRNFVERNNGTEIFIIII